MPSAQGEPRQYIPTTIIIQASKLVKWLSLTEPNWVKSGY